MALFGSLAATVARPAFAVACRGGVRAVRPSAGTGAPASWGQRWLSERPSKAKRRPETTQRQNNERRFVDCVRVFVRGGTGGQGSRRLCMAGGDGGDVVARATLGCHDLNEVADLKRLKADAGASAQRSHKPKPAQPLRIPVPVGTVGLVVAAGLCWAWGVALWGRFRGVSWCWLLSLVGCAVLLLSSLWHFADQQTNPRSLTDHLAMVSPSAQPRHQPP
eukprot:m.251114 g.251114  ORF g.251114 m.251114 type:complete len:220 (+) comp19105_c0_seq5:151-810(+)